MDIRKSGIILGLAVAIPGLCAAQASGPAETGGCIALERGDGDSPVIKARVNDAGPFAFVLDTASSGTTLDAARVALLSMQPDVETERAEGMSGAIDVRLYRLARFETGPVLRRGMTVPGVPAPSFRSHDIAGLAGIDLFEKQLAIWRWDRSCVDMVDSGTAPIGPNWRQTSSRWLKPWKIMLPMRIGAASGWGLLDTGAQKTVVSPGFARAIGLGKGVTDRADTISGIGGEEIPLAAHVVPQATVGQWHFEHRALRSAALPLFDRLGGMDAPVAVIGMDWIGTKSFAIDYGRQLVWQEQVSR